MSRNERLKKIKNKMDNSLQKVLAQQSIKSRSQLPVIFTLNRKMTKNQINNLRRKLGCKAHSFNHRLQLVNAISAKLTLHQIQKLCFESCIKHVHLDRKVKYKLDVTSRTIGSNRVRRSGLTGKGIGIVVIDTGIHPHPDLTKPNQRIIAFKDFVNHRKKAYDDNGHGTHVAGIAAGNGIMSNGRYRGQAIKAHLVGIKVLDRSGSGRTSNVVKGIEWAVMNRKRLRIRVLNISAGYNGNRKCSNDILCQATSKAWKAGLVVVAAASNEGPSLRTIGIPGNNPAIITVGAVNTRKSIRQSDDAVADFSGRGPAGSNLKPDLVAPGVDIRSLRVPNGYKTMSGTSMSTPVVSGAVALLLQRYPKLRPAQVKSLLKKYAYKLKASRYAQGAGELNLAFLDK